LTRLIDERCSSAKAEPSSSYRQGWKIIITILVPGRRQG
jgi:hypothetical protein